MNRYLSRTLWWDGTKGMATYSHATVCQLTRPPRINEHPVLRIDFAPLVGLWKILEIGPAGWRDLTQAEQDDIDKRLARMVNALHSVWD